jgi:hypothetical protein
VGKLKKIIICIIIIPILIFAALAIVMESSPGVIELRKVDLLYEMSDSELSSMVVDWNYKDMLRNSDDYYEKVIFVEGVVKSTQRDDNMITLYLNCDTEPEVICYNNKPMFMFVYLNWDGKSWLEEDQLSGFVRVTDPAETGSFSDTGEFIGNGDYIPSAYEIRLTCSNC